MRASQKNKLHFPPRHATFAVMADIERARQLRKDHFEALADSQRRRYFAWIEAAKREDTKLRRLKEAIRVLAGGKVLGLK